MRVLTKDESYFGLTNGFDNYLSRISNFCFVTDMKAKVREIYFVNNRHTYEHAYMIDSRIKQALENRTVTEKIILTFNPEFSPLKCFLYLDKKVSIQSLESLTKIGANFLDFISRTYKNEFSNSMHNACVETEERLNHLKKEVDGLSLKQVRSEEYICFVKKLFLFYKDMIGSPLFCVRASIILYSDDYIDIKEYVRTNLNLITKDKRNKINRRIEEYEVQINKNKVLPSKHFLPNEFARDLESYNYSKLEQTVKEEDFPKEIYHLFSYLRILFTNYKDDPKWELSSKLIQQLGVKKALKAGYAKFADFIENENDFLDLKLVLSKSQLYLMLRDYSNFVGTLQKFMENYLDMLGANQTRIKEKVKRAIELSNRTPSKINLKVVQLIATCFDDRSDSAIKKISNRYDPINYLRNDFQHGDSGINEHEFHEKLGYLTKEEFGEEEYSGIFEKFIFIFCLPEKNVFDQINGKVISLLKKPDF